MTNFIPIFPLSIVIYPKEKLHLHIFEPRYKQLIKECLESQKPFGIPTVLNNRLQDMGTLVQVTEIVQEYENGEMDINTEGIKVFRTLEVIKKVPDKLYSGAIVNYPDNNEKVYPSGMKKLMNIIRQLHAILKVEKDFQKPDEEMHAYEIAHHLGLSLAEEYELLNLMDERQRQEYVKRHLAKVIPMLTGMEELKEKIKLNGHFKNLGGFDL